MRICPECGRRTDKEVCPVDGLLTLDESILERTGGRLIGRLIARKYEVIAEIGVGGMGSVYRARHAETGGLVAIKVMAADRATRPIAIKRFHLEAQNAAALRHANTVRVLDFGVDDELLYLVMEYLEGAPLSAVLKAEGALPWPRAAHITRQVLKAIWEAHEHPRRIVHRDIKPENVFLCRQVGDEDFVKVVDFGVARSMEGDGAGTRGAIGTPRAMAPEQWSGAGDARSDLYSIGCLLYEMIAGRPPFLVGSEVAPADRLMRLAHMHMNQLAVPLSSRVSGLPAGIERLAHALLEKRPDDRPQTARETVALLDRALYGDELLECRSAVPDAVHFETTRHLEVRPAVTEDGRDVDPDASTVAPNASRSGDPAAPEIDHEAEQIDHEAATIARGDGTVRGSPALDRQGRRGDSEALEEAAPVPEEKSCEEAPADSFPEHGDLEPASTEEVELLPWETTEADGEEVAGGEVPASRGIGPRAGPAPRRPVVPEARGSLRRALLLLPLIAMVAGITWWARAGGRLDALGAILSRSREAGLQGPPTLPPAPAEPAGPEDEGRERRPDFVYRARLSKRDHRRAHGRRLRRAVDVILRDRVNFHAGRADPEDAPDQLLQHADHRRHLKRLLDRTLTREVERAILRGTPLVEVQVWPDFATVVVIAK